MVEIRQQGRIVPAERVCGIGIRRQLEDVVEIDRKKAVDGGQGVLPPHMQLASSSISTERNDLG